jgi:CRP-like cAMP-binding protein
VTNRDRTGIVSLCSENQLLAALAARDRERLAATLERVEFSRGQVLSVSRSGADHVYFPANGLFSILATTWDGGTVGVATIANEGVIGWPVGRDERSFPHRVVAEVPGVVLKAASDSIGAEFRQSTCLQDVLLRYMPSLFAQVSQSVVCHRFHNVLQRLARWLLVVRDKVPSDTLRMTQSDIARVLGIPRTGVTEAAVELKSAGVIWYRHGRVVIVSRERLEREACECYWAKQPEGESATASGGRQRASQEWRR